MTIQTPLAKAKGNGSAHEGSHHWWVQRLTAIANIPLTIWFVATVMSLAGEPRFVVLEYFKSPVSALLIALFIFNAFYHAALGLQVVIEDYVQNKFKKIFLLIVIKLSFFSFAAAAILSIAKMNFGN